MILQGVGRLGFLPQQIKILNLSDTFSQTASIIRTYKDKNFNVKLKPIFKTIAQNQYKLTQKFANNRTLGNGIIKGVETNSTPNNRKNSPGWARTNNLPVNSRLLHH